MFSVYAIELKEKYIDALIRHIGMEDEVGVFHSAIELNWWNGDGYEFLFRMMSISDADKQRIAEEVCRVS